MIPSQMRTSWCPSEAEYPKICTTPTATLIYMYIRWKHIRFTFQLIYPWDWFCNVPAQSARTSKSHTRMCVTNVPQALMSVLGAQTENGSSETLNPPQPCVCSCTVTCLYRARAQAWYRLHISNVPQGLMTKLEWTYGADHLKYSRPAQYYRC